MLRILQGLLLALTLQVSAVAFSAEPQQFGDWYVGLMDDGEGMYAATINDSGGLLGQYCYFESRNCVWLIANDVACEEDGSYVVLMNAEVAAAALQLKCFPTDNDKQGRYVFSDFDAVNDPLRKSTYAGFAFPLASGKFQVSRFPMNGMNKALEFMREGFGRLQKNRGSSGKTGDITI